MRRGALLVAFVTVLLLASTTFAHWDDGDPRKWVQMPDLEYTSVDVNATDLQAAPYIVADDFLCERTCLVRKIHIWGSWKSDYLPFGSDPQGVYFTVGIHADIPASQSPTGYSMPGEPLWYLPVYPNRYTVRIWEEDLNGGWLTPPAGYSPGVDTTCWQYNFWFREGSAFLQQGTLEQPVVYWLVVQAHPYDSSAYFGWRSSHDHWNDDATYAMGLEPYYEYWNELVYPASHPLAGQSIDLAFVIGDDTVEDWADAPEPYPTVYAANGANHTIVPGLLMGPLLDGDGNGLPDPDALGDDNDCADDEDGVLFWTPLVQGGPGMATIDMTTATVGGYVDAWIDFDADGGWSEPGDQIAESHWVPPGVYTTLHFGVPVDAQPGPTFGRFRLSSMGGLGFEGWAPDGEVEDHLVTIEAGEGWKWRQEPHIGCLGIDVNATAPYILADDWPCEAPGRIDEITVWGSWLGDLLPQGDPRMVKFTLSVHEDIPAGESPTGYSMPGEVLWIRDFLPDDYVASVWDLGTAEGWLDPPGFFSFPGDTTCWMYWFPVPPEEAFHQTGMPDHPVIYWLDVQAVPLDAPDARFGWKTTRYNWNDDAVWGTGEEPYYGDWGELIYPDGHSWVGQSIDLAFEVRSNYGTGVPEEAIEAEHGAIRNAPNPFNPTTTVSYEVPNGGGRVLVRIFDVSGRLVRTLVDESQPAGQRSVVWDGLDDEGRPLASGVYLARLSAAGVESEGKMVLLK